MEDTIYKHPPMKPHKFNNTFLELLSKLKNQKTALAQDLNFNLLNYNKKSETHLLVEGIFTNNFLPKITLPARVTKNSATLIEKILIRKEEAKTICCNYTTSISGHFPQFLILEDLLDKRLMDTKPTKMVRNFKNFNEKVFVKDIKVVDWSVAIFNNTGKCFENIIIIVKNLLNKHALLNK